MKKLDSHFNVPADEIKDKVSKIVSSLELKDFDRELWRGRVDDDFKIQKLALKTPDRVGFLGADSSVTMQNLRYHALWSIHCISLYGLYDGLENDDNLVGHGPIPYSNLMYSSAVDLGSFNPYWMVEQQMGAIRISKEYSALVDSYDGLSSSGINVDYALVDGSLKTNNENLLSKTSLKAVEDALKAQERLLSLKKVVSMAEDSHASDLARRYNLSMSNLMLFNLVLDEGEYVVDFGRFNVCYVKLPRKSLSYTDAGKPLTVRWEFSYPDFKGDLSSIAGVWLKENDLLHTQVYPLRIADYLTRRIKTSGLIDEVAREINPELEFRDMRESALD